MLQLLSRLVPAEVNFYQQRSPNNLIEGTSFVLNFSQRRGPGGVGIAQSV